LEKLNGYCSSEGWLTIMKTRKQETRKQERKQEEKEG